MVKGLVIGKFYPPHKGHKYLIDTAKSQVDQLTVIVCDKKGQTIPGELRAKWIREIHPGVKVMVINDTLDQDDSKAWAENTIKWLGYVPDVVFTSEDYGDLYAKYMGSKHILVDKERKIIPISGTQIRNNPYANWDFIEPCVRAYFSKRICVLGAESTGTTTMAQALAKYYQTVWVPEYGRVYSEAKMYSKYGQEWNTQEFEHIAKEQNRLEDKMAELSNRLVICDTNAFVTSIWHERYMSKHSSKVDRFAKNRKYDLYLVTDVDIPFVQDGTRDGEHIREWMHQRFVAELQKRKLPFVILSGSHEKRLGEAIKSINDLFNLVSVQRTLKEQQKDSFLKVSKCNKNTKKGGEK